MIPVTRPYLPDRKRIFDKLEVSYRRKHITNFGPLVNEYEEKLKEYLGVENLVLVANATIGLQLAVKSLGIYGSVATTSFSFAATSQCLEWVGAEPKFVDITDTDWNISVNYLAKPNFDKCNGVLATHVFGAYCDFEGIEAWANGRPVVYDAAHAFGTEAPDGSNCWSRGDASVCSLHATKILHSVEGGFIVFKNRESYEYARNLMNFGMNSSGGTGRVGTNAKMSELHAAVGLCVLEDFDKIQERRHEIFDHYKSSLSQYFQFQKTDTKLNNMYVPIIFESENKCMEVIRELGDLNIFPRRYFHPALPEIYGETASVVCPCAHDIASKILCLPSFHDLELRDIDKITDVICKIGR